MTLKASFSLVSCTVLLAVISTAGCGGSGSSSNKDGAAGSGGNNNSDAPGRGEINGSGGTAGEMDAATEGAMGGNPAEGGVAGSGGGTGGSVTDARPDSPSGSGGTGGTAADAAPDMTVIRVCAAGEMCTGNSMCNATRCLRGEREVCHCINDTLFCGPAPCDMPDANPTPDARPDAMTPACPMGIMSGDDCMGGTDRQCQTPCVGGRQRICFCNNTIDQWICTNFTRCM
jgi:hypothetical protein